jgi:DNA-binding MarR family transcriptional regulator
VLAALYREPEGMAMSDLSRFLLVSNGNVTGIVERLVTDGLVVRSKRDGDRRASIVRLTELGEERFTRMAAAHESWVDALLGGVGREEARRGFAEINPNHRLVQPEEVAAAAMWLVSDAAVSVTGQAIAISGGA